MRNLLSVILLSAVLGGLRPSVPAQVRPRANSEIDVRWNSRTNSNGDPALGTDQRVEALLNQMTLEEKIDLLGGVDGFFIRGVPRLNLPRLKMADGPIGVRNFGPATAMAAGIALAATWNPAMAERVGTEIGRDARAKGAHFLLGPGVNIYRAPMNA